MNTDVFEIQDSDWNIDNNDYKVHLKLKYRAVMNQFDTIKSLLAEELDPYGEMHELEALELKIYEILKQKVSK